MSGLREDQLIDQLMFGLMLTFFTEITCSCVLASVVSWQDTTEEAAVIDYWFVNSDRFWLKASGKRVQCWCLNAPHKCFSVTWALRFSWPLTFLSDWNIITIILKIFIDVDHATSVLPVSNWVFSEAFILKYFQETASHSEILVLIFLKILKMRHKNNIWSECHQHKAADVHLHRQITFESENVKSRLLSLFGLKYPQEEGL